MDKEQAIRILSAETSLEAIAELKQKANYDRGKVLYEIQTAMNMGAEALRKQIPKKPDDTYEDSLDDECAVCGAFIFERDKYCSRCGQKIKWGE